jgi:hypothetical protein
MAHTDEELDPFTYQPPTQHALDILMVFREEFKLLNTRIEKELPESRYRALVKTKLEEASMWLNKAIAFTIR